MTTRGFLHQHDPQDLLGDFGALPIRTVIRPTRFYTGLLSRLRDHRTMDDGVLWSAQADFTARLADWDRESDPLWGLHRAERSALVELNVPHFTTTSDGHALRDVAGTSIDIQIAPGLERAHARLSGLTDDEIAWQVEVIRQNTDLLRQRSAARDIGPPCISRSTYRCRIPRRGRQVGRNARPARSTQCDERGVDRP